MSWTVFRHRAQDLPGIRAILDRRARTPDSPETADARASYRPGTPLPERRFVKVPSGSAAFVARVKAVLESA